MDVYVDDHFYIRTKGSEDQSTVKSDVKNISTQPTDSFPVFFVFILLSVVEKHNPDSCGSDHFSRLITYDILFSRFPTTPR